MNVLVYRRREEVYHDSFTFFFFLAECEENRIFGDVLVDDGGVRLLFSPPAPQSVFVLAPKNSIDLLLFHTLHTLLVPLVAASAPLIIEVLPITKQPTFIQTRGYRGLRFLFCVPF